MKDNKAARDMFKAAVEAVMPQNLIKNSSYLNSIKDKDIYLFGSGKASALMAKAIEILFGDHVLGGVIISPYDEKIQKVKVFKSSHPIPSQRSIEGANMLLSKLGALKEDDLFIYLLSGGSSALIEKPIPPISLQDMIDTTNLLLQNGVPIDEINIVRKHLSLIKGGRLASVTKAKGIVLVISDVIGDDLEAIGSAPMFFDSSTIDDARDVLKRYGLYKKIPKSVKSVLENTLFESPKEPNSNIEHIVIGNNFIALQAAHKRAQNLGFTSEVVTDSLQGDVTMVAQKIVQRIINSDLEVLLFGGECTVNVTGEGMGGRNQELCLHVLKLIKDYKNITFLSGGTDGIDGNTKACGGIVDSHSYKDDIDDFLKDNDSHHFLKRGGNLLITKESGTNVMDIMIAIKGEQHV